ncbi:VOC family protein [Tsukamurella tyrosinosolvens]|nr:VOC family protein [Tsukamurella tyrosinosolvens]AUN41588.1 glyoxalase [Tsukamurella tyrosinosolvens]KXO90882.1 glyoxalase [Tsukamurella tyrosinosolvens]KXP06974.1 glyoxalase [Tsukamurella tyrosinosolvens]KZL98175.1 glyoxalase [Tsukamurella tyrosinosolvens]MEC4611866.1 VOC family protein [Tsukamurella tyrosinosolvens]
MTQRLRFDAIGMVTEDLPAALAFYRRLGLEIPEGAEDQPHVEAELPGGMRLMWDSVAVIRSMEPDWVKQPGQNATLCVKCASPAVVDEVHAELVAAGSPSAMAPFDAPWGQRYAGVLDPDGYQVQLFAQQ